MHYQSISNGCTVKVQVMVVDCRTSKPEYESYYYHHVLLI